MKTIGPYSPAVLAGDFLFVSGQIPLDPKTGALAADDIRIQTHLVFDHIEAILKTHGLHLGHVVKMEVYLKDLGEFQEMNTIYAERFAGHTRLPTRQAMQVAKLPRDARVEISCIAFAMKEA